jgi:hypothetical protein
MNVMELNRKLLYCGYSDITDYLRNSRLNRYLYKVLLNATQRLELDVPILTLLNEIYYQSIHVRYDNNPGVDVPERYFGEELDFVESDKAMSLIMSIVWVIFHLRHQLSFNEECFLEQVPAVLKRCGVLKYAESVFRDMDNAGIVVAEAFQPMPCPIEEIPQRIYTEEDRRPKWVKIFCSLYYVENKYTDPYINPWEILTDNFSPSMIEKYVKLYSKPSDQLALLDRIFWACPPKEREKHEDFIVMLRLNLSDAAIAAGEPVPSIYTQEEEDRMFAAGYQQTMEECEKDVVELYKQERDALKYKIEEQKRSFEMELAKAEAKYQAGISEAWQKKNQQVIETTGLCRAERDSIPTELTLTLSEIVDFVKTHFSKTGASEISTLLYRKAAEHGFLGEETFAVIDNIITDVIRRDVPQNNIHVPHAGQVNISPQQVITQLKEEKNSR